MRSATISLPAHSTNGTQEAPAKRQRKSRRKAKAIVPVPRARIWLTTGIGIGIPCLSLSLSSIGGRLIQDGHRALGASALILCCAVLAVSLSHLAWAIGDITRSRPWQSWCLAVTIDCALVLCELAGVAGFSLWAVPVLMACVTLASALLNCWAFHQHS